MITGAAKPHVICAAALRFAAHVHATAIAAASASVLHAIGAQR